MRMTERRSSALGSRSLSSISASRIAVPPVGSMCWMASMMVRRSPVGPVSAPRRLANGRDDDACRFGRRKAVSRAAASFTKSKRRDMLWLLSMSSANVAGTRSWLTRSMACATPSSLTTKLAELRPLDEPALAVVDAGLEQDARHLRDLGDLERPRARPCRGPCGRRCRRPRPPARGARTDSRRSTPPHTADRRRRS